MQEVFEKIRATDVDIIVESPKNNKHDGQQPYYCIRYYDLADKQVHIGFGSYCLDYVLQWKEKCFEIVDNINQVAKEYVPDINVGDIWKIVYDKVLELEKEYAMSGDIKNVNDCIRLENLLQYFKEELREENNQSLTNNNQSLTNGGWIPCSVGLPADDKEAEYYQSVIVTLDDGRVAEGCYRNRDKEWWVDAPDGEHYSQDMTGHVIAWQPLPEPYKEVEQ